jgi:hypothetical protein
MPPFVAARIGQSGAGDGATQIAEISPGGTPQSLDRQAAISNLLNRFQHTPLRPPAFPNRQPGRFHCVVHAAEVPFGRFGQPDIHGPDVR